MNAIAKRQAEERRTAAYWYATGRGVEHGPAWDFATCAYGEAYEYHTDGRSMLLGVIPQFEAWMTRPVAV